MGRVIHMIPTLMAICWKQPRSKSSSILENCSTGIQYNKLYCTQNGNKINYEIWGSLH